MPNRKPIKRSSRGKETKIVNSDTEQSNLISISFLHFQDTDNAPAQSLATWNEEKRLPDMISTLKHITSKNITTLQSVYKKIKLYGEFPDKSVNEFELPPSLKNSEGRWGTLRNIGGQKARIVGFLRDNIFYIVYLDRDHKFFKSNK